MKQQEVMELMQRYLDQDLTEKEVTTLKNYLKQDEESMTLFERMQSLSTDLAQLPKVDPPYSIVDAILPQLKHIDAVEHGTASAEGKKEGLFSNMRQRFSFPALGGAIAAAAVLGMLIFNVDQLSPTVHNAGDANMADSAENSAMVQFPASDNSAADDGGAAGQMDAMVMDSEDSADNKAPAMLRVKNDGGEAEEEAPRSGDGQHLNDESKYTVESSDEKIDVYFNQEVADERAVPEAEGGSAGFNPEKLDVDSDPQVQGMDAGSKQMPSPDGSHHATVTEYPGRIQVKIHDADGQLVYDTLLQQADKIEKVEWNGNNQLLIAWTVQNTTISTEVTFSE